MLFKERKHAFSEAEISVCNFSFVIKIHKRIKIIKVKAQEVLVKYILFIYFFIQRNIMNVQYLII